MAESGFVYCLSNRCMPGIYKVGFTRGSPSLRERQLSSSTGVPAEFEVHWYAESEEADLLEAEIHKALNECRVSSSREFFRCCPIEIFNLLDYRHESDWFSPEYLWAIEVKRTKSEGGESGQDKNS